MAQWLRPAAVRLGDPVRLPPLAEAAEEEAAEPPPAPAPAPEVDWDAVRRQAEEAGRAAGYEAGYQAGMAAARAALAPELAALAQALAHAREQAERLAEWGRVVAEPATWEAAAALAQAALGAYFDAKPEAFAAYVDQVAAAGPGTPATLAMGTQAYARWRRAAAHLEEASRSWQAVMDPALPEDLVVARAAEGQWAAGVSLSIQQALEAVLEADG